MSLGRPEHPSVSVLFHAVIYPSEGACRLESEWRLYLSRSDTACRCCRDQRSRRLTRIKPSRRWPLARSLAKPLHLSLERSVRCRGQPCVSSGVLAPRGDDSACRCCRPHPQHRLTRLTRLNSLDNGGRRRSASTVAVTVTPAPSLLFICVLRHRISLRIHHHLS